MNVIASPLEPTVIRQVFALWSIRIPASFDETFVHGHDYWHAWDADRSVSLTSIVVTDRGRPVGAGELLRTIPPLAGERVATPPGLVGWAVAAPAAQPARAPCAISGVIATDGQLLLATITGDDTHWATATWLSIRYGAATGRSGTRAPN
jgi:hypothetical protein